MFTTFLKYKLEEMGKRLVKVGRFFVGSQICSECGCKNQEVRNLAIRSWSCLECGKYHDRDTNAAINIRNEGMRVVNALIKATKTAGIAGLACFCLVYIGLSSENRLFA